MREQLLAWAEDCVVEGSVDLGEGRLSDQVNGLEVVTFFDATLHALDDGHEVAVDELEVGRGELHVIAVEGRRGDPSRRLRTVEERVTLELGPFVVTGNLHRPPNTAPLASLSRWQRFVPMTDALVGFKERETDPVAREVVLVNRDRVARTIPIAAVPVFEQEGTPPA
jgi:hypothetical protein